MKKIFEKYKHGWLFLYFALYLPWFFYLENTVTEYHIIHSSLDDLIPFCEYFIVPYLLWFFYIAAGLLYLFFKGPKEDYYRLSAMLYIGMSLCLLICTIYPNGQHMRVAIDTDKNMFTRLVSGLYSIDTSTNVFPSIHVYNSLAVHIAVAKCEKLKKYRWLQCASAILAVSICLATVFLKQHSVLDGMGAIVLIMLVYAVVYKIDYVALFSRNKDVEIVD